MQKLKETTMKNFRDYIDLVSENQVSEAAKKKVADKVFRQMVGPTPAARMAAELPSVARIQGQTWEKVGNQYYNKATNKTISPEEFNKLRASSGQTTTTGTTSQASPNYSQSNYKTTYNAPTTVPKTTNTAPGAPKTTNTAPGAVPKAKLAQRGSALKRFVQRNPKLAAALGIVAGVATYKAGKAAYDYITGNSEEETPTGPTTTGPVSPAPAPAPAPAETPNQSGKPEEPTAEQKWQAESDKLKAEIDALFKELEPVKDIPVPDELKRLRDKYQGTTSAGNSTTVSQSGKPQEKSTASTSGDSFRDTYAKFGQQNRREAEADAAQKKTVATSNANTSSATLTANEKNQIDLAFKVGSPAKGEVKKAYDSASPEKRRAVKAYLDSKGYDAKKTFDIDFSK